MKKLQYLNIVNIENNDNNNYNNNTVGGGGGVHLSLVLDTWFEPILIA